MCKELIFVCNCGTFTYIYPDFFFLIIQMLIFKFLKMFQKTKNQLRATTDCHGHLI